MHSFLKCLQTFGIFSRLIRNCWIHLESIPIRISTNFFFPHILEIIFFFLFPFFSLVLKDLILVWFLFYFIFCFRFPLLNINENLFEAKIGKRKRIAKIKLIWLYEESQIPESQLQSLVFVCLCVYTQILVRVCFGFLYSKS